MQSNLSKTLEELQNLENQNIEYLLTRFNRKATSEPDDLDILVRKRDFQKVIRLLNKVGYQSFSHDQALGGRIKGMQKNLVKKDRIKIDLHQDFTWRKTRYLDLHFIWNKMETHKIDGINFLQPQVEIDAFIILINTIFEKTYINKSDFTYIKDYLPLIINNTIFDEQAKKYGWSKTYHLFKKWYLSSKMNSTPIFLPVYLIIFSYIEKFVKDKKIDLISFMYYVFFRIRFQINGVLPYE